METQVSQVLRGTGVSQERPTSFQALPESQDKRGSEELQVRLDTSSITICITRIQYVVGCQSGRDKESCLSVHLSALRVP